MSKQKALLTPKWEFVLSIILFLGFTVVSVYYLIEIISGNGDTITIISLIVFFSSAVLWLVKVLRNKRFIKQ